MTNFRHKFLSRKKLSKQSDPRKKKNKEEAEEKGSEPDVCEKQSQAAQSTETMTPSNTIVTESDNSPKSSMLSGFSPFSTISPLSRGSSSCVVEENGEGVLIGLRLRTLEEGMEEMRRELTLLREQVKQSPTEKAIDQSQFRSHVSDAIVHDIVGLCNLVLNPNPEPIDMLLRRIGMMKRELDTFPAAFEEE